jgi:hypothetical protein
MMAAIGINVSTKDAVHGWESIRPAELSALEREYRHAKNKSDEANRDFIRACDYLESVKERGFNQDLIDMAYRALVEAEYRMDTARVEQEQAYKRLSCPHTHIKVEKGIDGDEINFCLMCGAII